MYHENEVLLNPNKWVTTKGLIVAKKPGEPFFRSKQPPHRLKKIQFFDHDSSEDKITEFDDSFYAEDKCEAFAIDYDGMDNDCDDCMFASRCRTETAKLGVDVVEHLERKGLKRPSMIEKIPSWRDKRPMRLIGHGTEGEITYDGFQRCKVCNGNLRVMIFERGEENWIYSSEEPTVYIGRVVRLDFTDRLTCPHCEVGILKVEQLRKVAKA